MQAFDYQTPPACRRCRQGSAAGAKLLAGGQSLLPSMKLGLARPTVLVDLGGIADLQGMCVAGGVVKIGAMTTHATVARQAEVAQAIPALAELAGSIGDRQVRHRGTIGGSLANNDPAACYPAAVLGLGATVHTDQRTIAADDFFTGLYETALEGRRGAGACVFRATALEAKLAANWSAAARQGATVPADGLNSDLHGSAEYRAALIPVLGARAVG
jgi:aerobic carbon-monoxide dehydrogenase medium subunit